MDDSEHGVRFWIERLPLPERAIADAALRLHQNFVQPKRLVGACYLLAFFLHQYARRELGIEANAVVGYACDETTPMRMSHAWLDVGGRKTDISLTQTEFPRWQLEGDLLVHDQVVSRARAHYSYHLAQSPESLAQVESSKAANPMFNRILLAKEQEHVQMVERATDDQAMWKWLQGAPSEVGYNALAAAAQGEPFRWGSRTS